MKAAWRSYRRNVGLILLFGLVVAAAMGVYTYHYEPDQYVSGVSLYIFPKGMDVDAKYNAQTAEMLVRDAQAIIRNPQILYKTEEKLSPDTLDGMRVKLSGIADTHIVRIDAYGQDPELCQRAATAVSVVFMEQMRNVTEIENISVAERAELPTDPVLPRRALKTALAFGVTFLLLSLLWLLFAPKRLRLRAEDFHEGKYGIRMLGRISDFRKDLPYYFRRRGTKVRILSQYVNRSTLEDVKAMAIALQQEPLSQRSLVLTSLQTDEGKSTLAALLAGELADQGKRVLVVDMDCYAPTIGRLFGVKGSRDLIHHLGGEVALDQIILPTAIPDLFVIDIVHPHSLVARMVGASAFAGFMQRMYQEFDYVLFDTPPISLFADAAALGSVLDATILVIAEERLTGTEVMETIQRLKKANNRLAGCVFTLAKPRRVKQYRDYEDSAKARAAMNR